MKGTPCIFVKLRDETKADLALGSESSGNLIVGSLGQFILRSDCSERNVAKNRFGFDGKLLLKFTRFLDKRVYSVFSKKIVPRVAPGFFWNAGSYREQGAVNFSILSSEFPNGRAGERRKRDTRYPVRFGERWKARHRFFASPFSAAEGRSRGLFKHTRRRTKMWHVTFQWRERHSLSRNLTLRLKLRARRMRINIPW